MSHSVLCKVNFLLSTICPTVRTVGSMLETLFGERQRLTTLVKEAQAVKFASEQQGPNGWEGSSDSTSSDLVFSQHKTTTNADASVAQGLVS